MSNDVQIRSLSSSDVFDVYHDGVKSICVYMFCNILNARMSVFQLRRIGLPPSIEDAKGFYV